MPYLLFIALLIATYPTHMHYNAEGYKLTQLQANGGCAIDNCPTHIIEGFVPLSKLKHGTKEYWRVYCHEMLNTKFECK